jgi:hypothetical protein
MAVVETAKITLVACNMGLERGPALATALIANGTLAECYCGGMKRLCRAEPALLVYKYAYLILDPKDGTLAWLAYRESATRLQRASVQFQRLTNNDWACMMRSLGHDPGMVCE